RYHLQLRELGDPLRAEVLQRLRVAIDRMTAPIQTQGFLLESQLLGLAPRFRVGQRAAPRDGLKTVPDARPTVIVKAAEQLRLPLIAVALRPRAVLARAVDRGQQPRPQRDRRQRLVGSALGERIER